MTADSVTASSLDPETLMIASATGKLAEALDVEIEIAELDDEGDL